MMDERDWCARYFALCAIVIFSLYLWVVWVVL